MTDDEYTDYMRDQAEKHGFGMQEDGTTNIGVGYDLDIGRVVMNFGNQYCLLYADKAIETGRALIEMAARLKGEHN